MTGAFDPYSSLYSNPSGPGDQRPTALQVVKDNDRINKLTDKVVLVTGATSGIGVETTRALHATGAHVYITARNMEKAKAVVQDILNTSEGKGNIDIIKINMDSLESVKQAAKMFLQKSTKLNILVNNAGIMGCPESRSKDGHELQLAVNHLAHFAFTTMLLPTLIASSSPDFNSRAIFVASSSHRFARVDFDNINMTGIYQPQLAYGKSKTANIWTANQIERLYSSQGVHALSLNPGGIWTELQRYSSEADIDGWKNDKELAPLMQSPAQGAATTLWAAVGKVWEGLGGSYVADCKVSAPAERMDDAVNNGYAPWAYDEESEEKLWNLSIELTGVTPP
ncbi:putative short-chain dehydrogenase [Corynespora cassiicola Philippines]|uniref:Putative short-chain dehydrogenase n=1 Tax=Corynespora cassiicola Philippines TaxID=1448308 RepID=A0A2T2NLN0_CORCC|nr:putative short-chain dehydrogenase [Corynespora cassiicola Philippines]